MTRTLRSVDDLVAAGLAPDAARRDLAGVAARYAIAVTPDMAALIDPAAASDPIGLQFLPRAAELTILPEENADPIGDHAHSPLPGLVHRYPDRVLVKLTHTCPVYCRFCFRREMVGPAGDGTMSEAQLAAAVAYVAARPEIFEVIFTGGDPLVLSARRIAAATRAFAAIPHVRVLRWHSRVPVVSPARITPALVRALKAGGKAVFVAVHANHAREFTPAAGLAIARMAAAGIGLVSQSVLLRGVNDSVAALTDLMRGFLAHGIKPYYLHHPDLAPGTAEFRLSVAEGLALVGALRGALSGLAQPHYVLDLPGGFGKVPVASGSETADGLVFTDRNGREHRYPPRPDSR